MQATLDRFISRVLFVPPQNIVTTNGTTTTVDTAANDEAAEATRQVFGFSLLMSGFRCVVKYILLPFILPVIGVATDVGAVISIGINAVAIGAILYSLRRFWMIDYKYKWQYLGVALVALGIVGAFMAFDVAELIA